MRKKILISAYAVSPYKGSEFGAAWNTIKLLAKSHDLWVLYGASDDHMGDTQTLDEYLKTNVIPGVTFIRVKPTGLASAINLLNKKGLNWCFYFAFYLWQREVLRIARQVLKNNKIDLIHQLGPIGFREPGLLWQLQKPFVWGPIGGTALVDRRLLIGKPLKTQIAFRVKNILTWWQLRNGTRVRKAIKRADVLIGARKVDSENIKNRFRREIYHLSEQGILPELTHQQLQLKNFDGQLRLVWSGRIDENKNLDLLLLALIPLRKDSWHLDILGEGPSSGKLKRSAEEWKISEFIRWHGHLDRDEAIQVVANAHLHVITSISEGNPAVLFEAMSFGVPTLSLDHCGMADTICDACGIKVPVETTPKVVQSITQQLEILQKDRGYLKRLNSGVRSCAQQHNWEKRLHFYNQIYDDAIHKWQKENC